MQKALITGASGGIGRELSLTMAKAGHDLVLVSRNKVELTKVKDEIAVLSNVKVSIYTADLSVSGSALKLYNETRNENIEILVNNAGVGLKGDFFHDDPTKTMALTQLNIISLVELSKLFGKDFLKNNRGKILNVGSAVAFLPWPEQPVYAASKAFVRSLSRALSYNLRDSNVTVTALHPGGTKTKFFKSSGDADISSGASASSVAELGYKAMMAGKIEVTHGVLNKFFTNVLVRFIPYRYHAYLIDKF